MSEVRIYNKMNTHTSQGSNMIHYIFDQQGIALPKLNNQKTKTIFETSQPSLNINRSQNRNLTIKSNHHTLPRTIDSIIEETEFDKMKHSSNNKELVANYSNLATLGTDYTTRNNKSYLIDIDINQANSQRESIKRLTTKKTTNLIEISKKKRTIFKNNEDLFNQVLNIPKNNMKQVTKKLLFKTQIRLLNWGKIKKTDDKMPLFNTTDQLNNYLISHYHLDSNERSSNSKMKMKISDETYRKIKQKKKDSIKKHNKTQMMMGLSSNYRYVQGMDDDDDDDDMNNDTNCNNNTVNDLINEYYSNRQKEKVAKGNKFLKKLKDLSNQRYQNVDQSNLISYPNLSRVIKVIKLKEDIMKPDSIIKQKKMLKDEDDKLMLALYKLGHPPNVKIKVRSTTEKKFKGIQGGYFGVPV